MMTVATAAAGIAAAAAGRGATSDSAGVSAPGGAEALLTTTGGTASIRAATPFLLTLPTLPHSGQPISGEAHQAQAQGEARYGDYSHDQCPHGTTLPTPGPQAQTREFGLSREV
ncbi:hypothetical protein [Nocardia terrae]|uniref:hypothetical protein n=1 Tax=Nocardia terrae TaxID=2675851 RepID=UPI0018DF7727|nr:hypothetical protein [Nocardia terrae]